MNTIEIAKKRSVHTELICLARQYGSLVKDIQTINYLFAQWYVKKLNCVIP